MRRGTVRVIRSIRGGPVTHLARTAVPPDDVSPYIPDGFAPDTNEKRDAPGTHAKPLPEDDPTGGGTVL